MKAYFIPNHNAHRISTTNPMTFCIGDIVEVNFSVVIMPVKQNKYQMMLVLRGLALLDSTLTTVSLVNAVSYCY